ncbi:transposase [Candidatus Enterovibrio escicola]|uniref:transposase n=1 Tax=Candidatus Enterovibrio escicola TaxID=1927127 RepID=UPI001238271B
MTLLEIKGIYLTPLKILTEKGINFITNTRKNVKPKVMNFWDCLMLKNNLFIETIFDYIQDISQIESFQHEVV